MSEPKLNRGDLKTPTIPGKLYLEKIQDTKFKEIYRVNYTNYHPNPVITARIRKWLENSNQSLMILGIGAEWCPDCQRNITALLKLEIELNDPRFVAEMLSGVKTNPLRRTGSEIKWAVPPSPPEVNDPKFAVKAIPMIYLFGKNGDLLGKITENPTYTKSVEAEILFLLEESQKK